MVPSLQLMDKFINSPIITFRFASVTGLPRCVIWQVSQGDEAPELEELLLLDDELLDDELLDDELLDDEDELGLCSDESTPSGDLWIVFELAIATLLLEE